MRAEKANPYRPTDEEPFMNDRQREYLRQALRRIEDGTYGHCEETGEPISIKRLEARSIATLSTEAQERHEHRERACPLTTIFLL
jgi:RNA polymerase-binding transcription factor DksA